ncbi:hypothetical protein H477_3922 [[Clostridium] sordellii ATCC 9714]|nr:hypothetical protein H477_3922 [[Clostridium] sordellii ATCC 9714] [Paeniclostridium sordellii ATCC 9714]
MTIIIMIKMIIKKMKIMENATVNIVKSIKKAVTTNNHRLI